MVSLASDVQELREAEPGPVTSEAEEELIGCLQSCPGLGEILCYSYCYLGLLTGPFYRPSTYRDWVRGPLPAVCWRRALGWARWAPALAALGELLARRFPPAALRGPGLWRRPPAARLLLAVPVFGAFRLRFYVGWLLAEAACLAAALGAYPAHAKPRPGQGPARPLPRPKSGALPPPELWDFAAIRTVDPPGTERSRSVGQGLRSWNLSVQWWLHRYVHRPHRRWPPPLRSAWTMLVSAFWHGLHPGFYLSFLSVPLWLAAEKALERAGAARGGLWGRLWGPPEAARGLGGQVRRFLTMRAFDYLSVGFMLRDAGATVAYWRSTGFCMHLLPLLALLLALLMGGPGRPPRKGGGGKGEGAEEEEREPQPSGGGAGGPSWGTELRGEVGGRQPLGPPK